MKVIFALLLCSAMPLHAKPLNIPDVDVAVESLNNALKSGVFEINSLEQAPTFEVLDWIGQSLASINVGMQNAFRRDPAAAQDYLSRTLEPVFKTAFQSGGFVTDLQAKLRREFLQQIKDIVMTEKFAGYTAGVERRWRADAEGRVMAYAQSAGFVATVTIVAGLVARYFDVSSATAIWETVIGTTVFSSGALLAMYKYLPLTRRFRNNANVVLKPVYDCASELLEDSPAHSPIIQLSAGRIGRSVKSGTHVGRGARRRPRRSEDSY